MKKTKRISGSANVCIGKRRTTNGKEGERGKGDDGGRKRGRKREEDGSLAPPRPCEASTKRDLRDLAVFGFTSFLCSRHENLAERVKERRLGWHEYRGL